MSLAGEVIFWLANVLVALELARKLLKMRVYRGRNPGRVLAAKYACKCRANFLCAVIYIYNYV